MSTTEENKVDGVNDQNEEWTVQTKPRRLVPQHALSKQDLEADKAKASAAASAPTAEIKKKVIRYSKEEMMTYRQPVKMLSSMAELTEILSTERQNPVCFERFEPEDVIRIWNSEKGGAKNLEGGRGRGRGKTFKSDEQSGEGQGEWAGSREGGGSGKGGLWDDSTAAGGSGGDGLDLSDFAAMALKFRSEMENMKLNGEGEPSSLGEDAMTLLADEQSRRNAGALEEEDEALPDWATDEPVAQPETKRSLLLDTLNIKRQPEPTPAPAPAVLSPSATASYGIGGGLDLNLSSAAIVSAPPPLVPRVEPTEWQYTDPAGQMQGPFPQDTMRAWHEAGYFNADLPIKLRHWQRFHPFQTVFPDFKVAFLSVPQEPGSGSLVLSLQQQQQAAAAALRQQQEEQRREQERLAAEAQRREAEQRAHQEALRQAELARQQEQARQAQIAEQQRQAQQLLLQQQAQQQAELEAQRALLEQQRQQQQKTAAPATQQPAASPAKPATVAPWANKQPGANRGQDLTAIQQEEAAAREVERKRAAAEQAKITKGWSAPSNSGAALSLAEIQAQEEEQRRRQQAEAARAAPAAAPATSSMSNQLKSLLGVRAPAVPASAAGSGPAWGTTGPAQSKPTASLKDIMQEENSGRAEDTSAPAAAPVSGGRKPTSWAAKAGSSTFSTSDPVAAPRMAVKTPPPSAATQPATVSPTPARTVPTASAAKPSATKNEKSSFGGKEMSPDMANWCAAQLKRLNGSDDLTLMQFCMSLDSAAEIRQYLSEYLGSSPAVTNFATDFIKYKEGGKKALESSGVALGGAGAPINSANNNNPSNFISAGKKKSGNRNK